MSLNNENINAAYARFVDACRHTEACELARLDALENERRLLAEYCAINAADQGELTAEYEALVAAYVVVAETYKRPVTKTYAGGAANSLAGYIAPSLSTARQYQAWEEAVRSVYAEK